MNYKHGKKSQVSPDAPSAAGIAWFLNAILGGASVFDQVEVRHAGRCGACGRHLTTPESIDSGFGPDCAAKYGIFHGRRGAPVEFDPKTFILGGNAYFTLTSKKTGKSFTYRVKRKEDAALFFVSVLNGPDNWMNYEYLGTIFADESELRGTKPDVIIVDDPLNPNWGKPEIESQEPEYVQ